MFFPIVKYKYCRCKEMHLFRDTSHNKKQVTTVERYSHRLKYNRNFR